MQAFVAVVFVVVVVVLVVIFVFVVVAIVVSAAAVVSGARFLWSLLLLSAAVKNVVVLPTQPSAIPRDSGGTFGHTLIVAKS